MNPELERTITLRLSAVMAYRSGRTSLGSYRCSYKSINHALVTTDLATESGQDLPSSTKFVVIATEADGIELDLTKDGDTVTLELDQVALIPGEFQSPDKITVRNTSVSQVATIRYMVM